MYQVYTIFMPPFEKRGHIVLHMSVGPSVDQMMSAQYLLTPFLESCQTWYNGCPKGVDDLYWFWGHMVKDQGQTAGVEKMLSS